MQSNRMQSHVSMEIRCYWWLLQTRQCKNKCRILFTPTDSTLLPINYSFIRYFETVAVADAWLSCTVSRQKRFY